MTPRREAVFEPLEQPRAHELVAEQIRRQIRLHLVPAGGALPSERELARMFGVGRATVQLALGLLEKEQLVRMRRGRGGGTFVVGSVGVEGPLDRVLADIRRRRREIEDALAFRLDVEPAAAAHAAERAGAEDLAAVEAAVAHAAAAHDDAAFMEHDTEFHLAVGRATRNTYFADSIERLRLALNDPLVALPDSAIWHDRSNGEHAAIVAALVAGDSAAARRAMAEHVRHTDRSVRALLQALAV